MASTTSNLGLTKPAGTDKALVSVINTNSDILDRSAGGLMDAIAIVANGNTHAAISAGQYVYVHNHGTLAEGLYTANSAIAANATLSTSNLTADASGGLNALNSKFTWRTLLNESNVSVGNTFASTEKSFTLTKYSLVRVDMSYGTGRPLAIGLKLSESTSSGTLALTSIVSSDISDTSGLSVTALLTAGTYYVWARTASATGSTNLMVQGITLGA